MAEITGSVWETVADLIKPGAAVFFVGAAFLIVAKGIGWILSLF